MEFIIDNQVVLIDDEDWTLVQGYNWHISRKGYVVAKIGPASRRRDVFLHRLVLRFSFGDHVLVDHIHHILTDCRKSELRTVNYSQNSMNHKVLERSSSRHSGVCFDRSRSRWKAYIGVSRRRVYLGNFNTKEDSIRARNLAEKLYFGEYAYIEQGVSCIKI